MKYHSVNGRIVSHEEATIPLGDIGFRRGFTAFDYLRVIASRPLFLEDHLDRFWRSCGLLGLALPLERSALRRHLHEVIERNELGDAGMQLFLSGGIAADGFTPETPNLAIYVTDPPRPDPELYHTGARLIGHLHRREFPEAKTTNYQMAVRQVPRMRQAGAIDVLYHHDGLALETSRSNLFLVDGAGRLATPGKGILAGVTRTNVLRAVADHREVAERDLPLTELWSAAELFITSTTKGVLPITAIDDRPIGSGMPGAVTREVAELFRRFAERYLAS